MTVNEKGLEAALAIPLKGRFWPGENAMESEDSNWLYYKRERYSQIIEAYLRAASKDALVHVDGVTMTPTAAANRIAELSAAQADHSTAIEPVAASPGVGAVNDGEIRLDEGALKAAMAAKPWPAREYTVALLMEQGGCGTETLSAAIRAYLAAAPTSPAPSPSTEDVMGEARGALAIALSAIEKAGDDLQASGAYPVGALAALIVPAEQVRTAITNIDRALSSKQRSGE